MGNYIRGVVGIALIGFAIVAAVRGQWAGMGGGFLFGSTALTTAFYGKRPTTGPREEVTRSGIDRWRNRRS